MRIKLFAVVMILAVAAWAQNAPAPAASSAPADAKASCACCQHMHEGTADAHHDHGAMACGHDMMKDKDHAGMACCGGMKDKDGKAMACGSKDGKGCCGMMAKAGDQAAMSGCCGKDAKSCSGKDGKGCCGDMAKDGKSAMSCCGGENHCNRKAAS